MFKVLAAFLGGFICACIMFIFVFLPKEDRLQYDYGFKNGAIHGSTEAIDAIQKEFGTHDSGGPHKVLFSVHTAEVISIETNGVKTVRVIP
jgi:hypothetical protein